MQTIKYYLSEHPTIVNFRWSPTNTWFSTWSFLCYTLTSYILIAIFLHLTLSVLFPDRGGIRVPLGLGPIPTLHNLVLSVLSSAIFLGALLSAIAEIQDNHHRWLWRATHLQTTPVKWLLCFPPGTRPTGRVFFWSYAFYLSRLFLHLPRTFLKRRRITFFHVLSQSSLLVMAFLWLEFSQSFQVVAVLLFTLLYALVYGYRFWADVGLPRPNFPLWSTVRWWCCYATWVVILEFWCCISLVLIKVGVMVLVLGGLTPCAMPSFFSSFSRILRRICLTKTLPLIRLGRTDVINSHIYNRQIGRNSYSYVKPFDKISTRPFNHMEITNQTRSNQRSNSHFFTK
ncbi:Elongation of fatty acids protein 3-like [Bienertia sinuspersici]